MPKPENLPDCQYRGAEHGAICFCRHPHIAGKLRSIGVEWSQCETCPLASQIDGQMTPDTGLPLKKRHKPTKPRVWKLGDQVESALTTIGVTKERVSAWVGAPCGCAERREKLNRLSEWAQKALSSGAESAKQALSAIVGEGQ